MEYYVYMTNDCNLMCEYCSVLFDCKKNNVPILPSYPIKNLISFIERTQKETNDRDIRVFFFGGEPSMEYEAVERYIDAIEDSFPDFDVKFVLHTNGLMLGEIPDNVLFRLSLIILSFNYEKIPQHHLKDSYFSLVIQNLIQAKEKSGIAVTARITVTEKTSLFIETSMVKDFCDDIYFQIENCSRFHDYDSFYKTYTFEVSLLYRLWKQKLLEGALQRIIPFMAVLKFMFFSDRDDNLFCCGYDRHQIYVQTNGLCYSCCDSVAEGIHNIGSIEDGIHFCGFHLTDFICGDCAYRGLCLGRCARMHREFELSHIKEYCSMNQYMFDLFLNDREILKGALDKYPHIKEGLNHWTIDIMELTP